MADSLPSTTARQKLAGAIKRWALDLGFQQAGITGTNLDTAERLWREWLQRGWHGEMEYMARHGSMRGRPDELFPGTLSIISVRIDYLPETSEAMWRVLNTPEAGYISRYALGRDYHKVVRQRLQRLAQKIQQAIGAFDYRVFCDSAPVLEKPLAQRAGLGWIGKHTNLIHRTAGSWFFLGEIYTDLDLPHDAPTRDHCGTCRACIEICPTGAIVAPYQLDARRCIAYLTIELRGSIPEPFRPLIGNRIYGCDDCQLVCPWNRFAQISAEQDFQPRHGLDHIGLIEALQWDEATFLHKTEGSAIRRIGYRQWLRNVAVALGNAPSHPEMRDALARKLATTDNAIVREHLSWALQRQSEP